jgi:hypothetical protein
MHGVQGPRADEARPVAKRVCFVVDGFNLYYSLRDVEGLTGSA